MQQDDDPLRPWNPAEWDMKPVKRPPLPKAPHGVIPTWLGIGLALIVALGCATIIAVCTWIIVWAIVGK